MMYHGGDSTILQDNPYRNFEAAAEMNPMIQDQIPIVFTHIKIPIIRGISCER
ncbi:hypothetical protein VAEKB19_140003 [Vibrio aestuarianus]|nr:hypothetical protein VAEKB19_140003 [Vibrio aestuarianus]